MEIYSGWGVLPWMPFKIQLTLEFIIVQPMLQPRTKPVEKQPRSSYPVLFKITRELYTLGFRPKQRWIGDVEGASFSV